MGLFKRENKLKTYIVAEKSVSGFVDAITTGHFSGHY